MPRFNESRRRLLQGLGASSTVLMVPGMAEAAKATKQPRGRVVVIGAGFAGATAAKYLRKWSDKGIDVTLIERNAEFISCPTSNEVLGVTEITKRWCIAMMACASTGALNLFVPA